MTIIEDYKDKDNILLKILSYFLIIFIIYSFIRFCNYF